MRLETKMDDFLKRRSVVVALAHKECGNDEYDIAVHDCIETAKMIPAANVVEIPRSGIGNLSDGYHTFNGLYYQRMVLFAALVKAFKDRARKSYRHEDGELCFGGGWFIVGIDTPEGNYTYHYENKDFDLFDCEELPVAKHWDGHTEEDVTRLLSLPGVEVRPMPDVKPVVHGFWWTYPDKDTDCDGNLWVWCSECDAGDRHVPGKNVPFCWHCGAEMSDDVKRLWEPPNCGAEMSASKNCENEK